MLAMFQYEVANAVIVWWGYAAYSHCFLIIPICAWLVWRKRAQLAPMTPVIAPKALFIFPFLILVWLAGVFATINEVRQFSVVAMMVAAILTLVSTKKIFRIVLFPRSICSSLSHSDNISFRRCRISRRGLPTYR